jgi:hypothetical protein
MTQEARSEVIITIPRSLAWEKLRDISLAHHYVPGIIKTRIVSPRAEGVGASRYVYRRRNRYLQETVEEWHEGQGFALRLHKGEKPAAPFKDALFRYQLADHGPEHTLVRASLRYSLPWGALGRWLETRMLAVVQASVNDVVCCMKLYYETGKPIGKEELAAYRRTQQ